MTLNAKQKLTEKVLTYKVQANKDQEAFAKLYDIYVEPIYRFVYMKISNRQDAEDVSSDVFLQAWQYMIKDGNKKVENFKSFIYSIARNKIIDTYRARAKKQSSSLDSIPEVELSDGSNIEEEVAVLQEVDQVYISLKKLKQEYQEVIFLRHIEELSIAEIASIVGKRNTAVRVLLHRAMKKLQDIL